MPGLDDDGHLFMVDRIFIVHPDPATNSILTEILLPCQDMIASLLHGMSGTVLPRNLGYLGNAGSMGPDFGFPGCGFFRLVLPFRVVP